jgi:O-succinylhomoserine sulfhydrylase
VPTLALATWLSAANVARVYYPGLVSHPQHDLAMQQQTLNGQGCGGAVLSLMWSGDPETATRTPSMVDSTCVCSITANLGDTKTTIIIDHVAWKAL